MKCSWCSITVETTTPICAATFLQQYFISFSVCLEQIGLLWPRLRISQLCLMPSDMSSDLPHQAGRKKTNRQDSIPWKAKFLSPSVDLLSAMFLWQWPAANFYTFLTPKFQSTFYPHAVMPCGSSSWVLFLQLYFILETIVPWTFLTGRKIANIKTS